MLAAMSGFCIIIFTYAVALVAFSHKYHAIVDTIGVAAGVSHLAATFVTFARLMPDNPRRNNDRPRP